MTGTEKIVEGLKAKMVPVQIDADEMAKFLLNQVHAYLDKQGVGGRMAPVEPIVEAVIRASAFACLVLGKQIVAQCPEEKVLEQVRAFLDNVFINQRIGNGFLLQDLEAALVERGIKG